MSKRIRSCVLACLTLALGCAGEVESDEVGVDSMELRACTSNARQASVVAADVRAALAHEAAEEGSDANAPASSPEVSPRGTVKAVEREGNMMVKLPVGRTACGSAAKRPDNSLTVFTSESEKFSTALLAGTDGAFRALVHIESAQSPTAYRFELDVPEGGELLPLEDGGVVVRNAAGDLLATFTPPWATDANGVPVPTRYEINGTTVIQHIELGPTTAYPVVGNPFWIPVLWVTANLTRHALTQMAARGVSQEVVKRVVLNGARRAGNRGTSIFTQGSGRNRIRVIVDNRSGNIITVTKG